MGNRFKNKTATLKDENGNAQSFADVRAALGVAKEKLRVLRREGRPGTITVTLFGGTYYKFSSDLPLLEPGNIEAGWQREIYKILYLAESPVSLSRISDLLGFDERDIQQLLGKMADAWDLGRSRNEWYLRKKKPKTGMEPPSTHQQPPLRADCFSPTPSKLKA